MKKKIKIAMITTSLGLNGISSVIINYCSRFDMNKFEITIFAGSPINNDYFKLCKKKGIKIVELPPRKPTTIQYYYRLFKNIKKREYDILHVHGNSSAMAIELFIGIIKKIKVRIAHCHNAKCSNPKVNKLFSYFLKISYTKGLACSKDAGNWVFKNKEFTVIPNGFEISKFKFNIDDRIRIRKELNLENDFVIGHIGRFNSQKNQQYLIKVFDTIADTNKNIKLLYVGKGPDYDNIREVVNKYNYKDRIIFYGETNDTSSLYSAMDLFAFPSKYEGLGIALLEAQINGLKCIASSFVPKEVAVTKNIKFINIDDLSIKEWSRYIIDASRNKKRESININDNHIQKFNINRNIELLENIYINEVNKSKKKREVF